MLKPLFAQLTRSAFFNCILASCVAGAIAAVVLCPAEEVRIRTLTLTLTLALTLPLTLTRTLTLTLT